MSTPNLKQSFDDQLAENLQLYVADSEIPHQNLFNIQREISIARYALTKQAEAYAKGIEVFFRCLEIATDEAVMNPKLFADIMVAINAIETRSQSLIASVQKVTGLLGQVVNINIDKAALSHLILRLPSLTKEAITQVSGDSLLAERVSSDLNHRVSSLMVALRFSEDLKPVSEQQQESSSGITLEEYTGLFDTIPSQPLSPATYQSNELIQ